MTSPSEERSPEDRLRALEEANNLNAESLAKSLQSLSTQHVKINVMIQLVCDVAGITYDQFFERCNEEQQRIINTSRAAELEAAGKEPVVEKFGGDL